MSSVYDLLGRVDNLHDPVPLLNTKPAVFGLVITFLVVATLCGAGRLWTRLFVTKSPGWDDGFVVAVLLSNIALSVSTLISMNNGLGQHFILLGIANMPRYVRTYYVANATYPQASTLIKLALLFQYLRIWDRRTLLGKCIVGLIVLMSLWGLAFTLLAWFPCYPISGYWNWQLVGDDTTRWGYGSHNPVTFVNTYLAHVSTNMIFNLIVLAIPFALWESTAKIRWGLITLFVLGACVNAFSIVRLVLIVQNRAGTYPTLDPSWYACPPIILACLEVNLATICASLPVFWPVLAESSIGQIFVTREVDISHEDARLRQGSDTTTKSFSSRSESRSQCDSAYAGSVIALSPTKSRFVDEMKFEMWDIERGEPNTATRSIDTTRSASSPRRLGTVASNHFDFGGEKAMGAGVAPPAAILQQAYIPWDFHGAYGPSNATEITSVGDTRKYSNTSLRGLFLQSQSRGTIGKEFV